MASTSEQQISFHASDNDSAPRFRQIKRKSPPRSDSLRDPSLPGQPIPVSGSEEANATTNIDDEPPTPRSHILEQYENAQLDMTLGADDVPSAPLPDSTANASTTSLSAFSQPSTTIPPVILVPLRPLFPPPRSVHVLEVDPPLPLRSIDKNDEKPPAPQPVSDPSPETEADLGKSASQGTPTREVHPEELAEPDEPINGFDETALPTQQQLEGTAILPVISESGVRVPFGSLWKDQKTIVCFIRHFWCPLCQDYMFSISRNVSPQMLRSVGLERQIFHTPFALYTDPTRNVYNALGMTLHTTEKGSKGSYVLHGFFGGIKMVLTNAVKVGMPVWKEGGKISQLGGEFILGPGMHCSWAHRMRYTRSHTPILQVIEAAGANMYALLYRSASSTGSAFLGMTTDEGSKWMDGRRKVLAKLRDKKMSRRGGQKWIDTASRSSVVTAGSLCSSSWDPSTEQAIDVDLMGYDTAIIKEAEEAEQAESEAHALEPEPELEQDSFIEPPSETQNTFTYKALAELDPSESLVSEDDLSDSELGTPFGASETDKDSTMDVDIHNQFDAVDVHFDKRATIDLHAKYRSSASISTFSSSMSDSSVGSGYEDVVHYHQVFWSLAEKPEMAMASMSESSLGSY